MSHVATPIKARDWEHLKMLVDRAMADHGPLVDLNHIDVSSITSMTSLFDHTNFNGHISEWDVANVVDMNSMFMNCPFNGDIERWDVSNVAYTVDMFHGSKFNGGLSKWNTSSMEHATRMFQGCHGVCGLEQWDVSNVVHMNSMFAFSHAVVDLSSWDVSRVETMSRMFACGSGKTGMERWNVPNVHNMIGMFEHYNGPMPDISNWDMHPAALRDISQIMDRVSILKATEPDFLHWYHLIEKPSKTILKKHPDWVDHLDTHLPMLLGLGMSTLQSAGWLQKAWVEGPGPIPRMLDLPELG